jgi:probable HAF family extracellular repeat protein
MTPIRTIQMYCGMAAMLVCVAACSSASNSATALPAATDATRVHRTAAQSYTIIDLGTLPGQNTSEASGSWSFGGALNKQGQVAGLSSQGSGAPTAALFSDGNVTNLNTIGANYSIAFAINNASQLVGTEISPSDQCGCFRAFLYSGGSMKTIDPPSLFPDGAIAFGINSSGQVVGAGYLTTTNTHAFLYSGGQMVDIGGGSQAEAEGINDAGQVVGGNDGVAFLYANSKMTSLGMPTGASGTRATAINRNGQIVGWISFANASSHGALYSNGAWTDLGTFPGASQTVATGINTGGQIVGTTVFPTQYHPFKAGKHLGWVYVNGAKVDLDTLIPPNSGFTITGVAGINDSGQVAADAITTGGFEHAVLLTPQ